MRTGDTRPARSLRKGRAGRVLRPTVLSPRRTVFASPLLALWFVTVMTLVLCILLALVLVYSVIVVGNTYVAARLWTALIVLAYIVVIIVALRRRKTVPASYMLLIFYYVLGVLMTVIWGVSMSIGLLMFGFVITLAGITLGARAILPVTAGVVLTLAAVQLLVNAGVLVPMLDALAEPTSYRDVITFSSIFVIFAVVSWLSGRRMEISLARALAAESALQKEKDSLAGRLEQKTREVREAQLEEMRGLYRFAELGQLGTVLLHDLANNLTALTLDIDDIEKRTERTESVTRARQSISYLENVVRDVRGRIQAEGQPRVFDAIRAVFDTVTELGPKARRAGVLLLYERDVKDPFYVKGDPLRLSHALTILISNAIEAYADSPRRSESPTVTVSVVVNAKNLIIKVTDHGVGIPARRRARLFQPFQSTKSNGMGIGLFMAKSMIEQHFRGTVALEPDADGTVFNVTLEPTRARYRVNT